MTVCFVGFFAGFLIGLVVKTAHHWRKEDEDDRAVDRLRKTCEELNQRIAGIEAPLKDEVRRYRQLIGAIVRKYGKAKKKWMASDWETLTLTLPGDQLDLVHGDEHFDCQKNGATRAGTQNVWAHSTMVLTADRTVAQKKPRKKK